MTITPTKLFRAAGLSAALAGLLYIFIQFIHPHEDLATVETTGWVVTAALTGLMAAFGLIGITGIYLRQTQAMGMLGLIGYLLYAVFFLTVIAFSLVETLVLPTLADEAPRYVSDTLALFTGGTIDGDLGPLKALNPFAAVTYLLGGLLFGIALVRAGVLARWAALLLAVGTLAALAVPLVPHSLARMAALPVGLALVGLGYSLMRERRAQDAVPSLALAGAR